MPPTISVTVGRPEALLAAFDPVAVELLELLELLELPQAARTAVSAATLAALAILITECLNIGLLLLVWVGVVRSGFEGLGPALVRAWTGSGGGGFAL
jgi:hypothetical protein